MKKGVPGVPILEKHNLPYDKPAENALISGWRILPGMPQMLIPYTACLKKKGPSYTMHRKYRVEGLLDVGPVHKH